MILRPNIELMPLFVSKALGLGEPLPTNITLLLSNRSHIALDEIIKDVLIRLGKFDILVDFIILGFQADVGMPVILGHPFLDSGGSLIDV